jgi:manganese/zinc/iron transport system permease protein
MLEWLQSPDGAILTTGVLVGVASALLGPFLILRQNAMLADAISHAIVFGIMLVWMLTGLVSGPLQIIGAGLSGVLCVWLIERVRETGLVREDAAIGLVFPALFALGVLMLNLFARDVHIDVHTVLLGEIGFVWLDTVTVAGVDLPNAVIWMSAMALVNALFVGSTFMSLIVSIVTVLLFSGVTAYETQMIKEMYVEGDGTAAARSKSIFGAFMLYGSFVTLFIHILNILGIMRSE